MTEAAIAAELTYELVAKVGPAANGFCPVFVVLSRSYFGVPLLVGTQMYAAADWEESISEILDEYEAENKKEVLHSVYFY